MLHNYITLRDEIKVGFQSKVLQEKYILNRTEVRATSVFTFRFKKKQCVFCLRIPVPRILHLVAYNTVIGTIYSRINTSIPHGVLERDP